MILTPRQISAMTAQHDAAILSQPGGSLSVGKRLTPKPGPNDVLIEVKAVALNPCDYYQRDYGIPPVAIYPAVIGCDAAGVVAKLGLNVTLSKHFSFIIYITASLKHHNLVKKLRADVVFDYKNSNVVSQIINTVKMDWIKLHTAHCMMNDALQPTLNVLKKIKDDVSVKVTHSAFLPEGHSTFDNMQIAFVMPFMNEVMQSKHMKEVFCGWLHSDLKSEEIVPSLNIQIEGGALGGVHAALDKLNSGVSSTKIVVSV
ncbi:hypothetical protein AJ79_10309 [Helicocarpus griseus UAMH5409]|uniref:Alcohol dehydrogenase-like N-terminal domain-containing protein n=1 Tax=Helicocarpus griseus UAMH5409 TaxID=1447875 RepID=A0A2B7WEX7_9EURO|nr:hypothetical protein AJ79_10309 [Helicocarpus griseus UAMH5409]